MPKIIFNAKEQLLCEAKRQVMEKGYAATTMRSVAGACGFAVGTMYNYFDSKEALVAAFVAEDWKVHLDEMASIPTDCPKTLFFGIYNSLINFVNKNRKLFYDCDAAKILHVGFKEKHKMFIDQLSGFILPVCLNRNIQNPEYTSVFVAETILAVVKNDADFENVYPIIERIITN